MFSTLSPVGAGSGNTADRWANPMTVAIIGGVPYGSVQEAVAGDLIGAVNDDPKVRPFVHVDFLPVEGDRPRSDAADDGLQGDSHQFLADDPLGLPNLTGIVVQGETLPFEYPRVTVDPRAARLFSWERVQVAAP